MNTRRDLGPFLPLFGVSVEHMFHAPQPCPALSLLPTPVSAANLQAAGCLVRETPNGVDVYYDASASQTLRGHAQRQRWPFEVLLLGRSPDPAFHLCTEGLSQKNGWLPLYDSLRATGPDANGQRRLHASEFADAGQHRPTSAAVFRRALKPRPGALPEPPPAFVVRVVVSGTCRSDQTLDTALAAASAHPSADPNADTWAAQHTHQRYVLRLQARATHWKYYLPADWAEDAPQVVDLQGQAKFGAATHATLGDGRSALTVTSTKPIALHARPTQRFQLRAGAAAAERVLVKRLPVASAGQFNLEKIDGVRTLVSEIYLQR